MSVVEMDIFWLLFWLLILICIFLHVISKQKLPSIEKYDKYQDFQRTYLVVFVLAMGADWLQGPYVYALYQHYGMTSQQIDYLFVIGFGSSLVFGTFAGTLADKYGRRLNCIAYAVLYICSCLTKHFTNFWVLAAGRLFGGIATSILFSAFESWAVCEHHKRGFGSDLSLLFSQATLCNSVVSIAAGQLAQVAADRFGFVSPFDLSIFVLLVLIVTLSLTWNENYGDTDIKMTSSLSTVLKLILNDKTILMLGLVQSLFESSMYIFVLKWTPLLSLDGEHYPPIPHGLIFSSFMVCVTIGSSLFKIMLTYTTIESFMRYILLLAGMSLLVPVLVPQKKILVLLALFIFEVCVGIFWPSIGTMRGVYIPDNVRSTVMNVFRIPLNLLVIIVLLQDFDIKVVFVCSVLGLILASLAQSSIFKTSIKEEPIDKKFNGDVQMLNIV